MGLIHRWTNLVLQLARGTRRRLSKCKELSINKLETLHRFQKQSRVHLSRPVTRDQSHEKAPDAKLRNRKILQQATSVPSLNRVMVKNSSVSPTRCYLQMRYSSSTTWRAAIAMVVELEAPVLTRVAQTSSVTQSMSIRSSLLCVSLLVIIASFTTLNR